MPCEIEVFEQKGVVRKAGMGERMRGDSMIKQALPLPDSAVPGHKYKLEVWEMDQGPYIQSGGWVT